MYLQSDDDERNLIEEAIREAQLAEQEEKTSFFTKVFGEVKSWFSKSHHNNDHTDPSPGAQAMS